LLRRTRNNSVRVLLGRPARGFSVGETGASSRLLGIPRGVMRLGLEDPSGLHSEEFVGQDSVSQKFPNR